MITELTPAQEEDLLVYRDKWQKIAMSTTPITQQRAQELSDYFYIKFMETRPVPVILADGPRDAWRATYIAEKYKTQPLHEILAIIADRSKYTFVPDFVMPYIDGAFSSGYFAFYDYCLNCLNTPVSSDRREKYEWYMSTHELGLMYPLDHVCIIAQKPTAIHLVDNQPHCDGGPALAYADGFKVFALNGIVVPEYLAVTPKEELDVNFYFKENQLDIKTEFLIKYGLENMVNQGKVVDSFKNYANEDWAESEYIIYDMSALFPREYYAPHLWMKNLTTGVYHLEGVHPNCKTLPEALRFREGDMDLSEHQLLFVK